jgi:hypothetical protein
MNHKPQLELQMIPIESHHIVLVTLELMSNSPHSRFNVPGPVMSRFGDVMDALAYFTCAHNELVPFRTLPTRLAHRK